MHRTHAQTLITPEPSQLITAATKRTYVTLSKIRMSFRAEKTTRTLRIWVINRLPTPTMTNMVGPKATRGPS